MTGSPLEFVCGYQWYSAHKHVTDHFASGVGGRVLKLKFERLLAGKEQLKACMAEMCAFVNIPYNGYLDAAINKMPVVMATHAPRLRRWMARREQILPVVRQRYIADMAANLGYKYDSMDQWL